MKKAELFLLVCLIMIFVAPSASFAQGGDPPPPCCPRSPGILPGETQTTLQSPTMTARFVVTQGMLQSHRLTRRQFVDRLLQGLLPAGNVDILVYDKVSLDQLIPAIDSPNFNRGRQALLVQETRIFRIPLADVTVGEFEGLDHIALTDGEFSIEIRFVAAGPIDSGPDGL